jgi:hypothetical protein
MDESPGGRNDVEPGATDEDVEAAVSNAEPEADLMASEDTDESSAGPGAGLPDDVLNAPASAEEADHTLLEEYEREQESVWKGRLRTAAFWLGATGVSVAVTLTAIVSLTSSGLSDGVAFILASVGMAVIVGFVFLSIRA